MIPLSPRSSQLIVLMLVCMVHPASAIALGEGSNRSRADQNSIQIGNSGYRLSVPDGFEVTDPTDVAQKFRLVRMHESSEMQYAIYLFTQEEYQALVEFIDKSFDVGQEATKVETDVVQLTQANTGISSHGVFIRGHIGKSGTPKQIAWLPFNIGSSIFLLVGDSDLGPGDELVKGLLSLFAGLSIEESPGAGTLEDHHVAATGQQGRGQERASSNEPKGFAQTAQTGSDSWSTRDESLQRAQDAYEQSVNNLDVDKKTKEILRKTDLTNLFSPPKDRNEKTRIEVDYAGMILRMPEGLEVDGILEGGVGRVFRIKSRRVPEFTAYVIGGDTERPLDQTVAWNVENLLKSFVQQGLSARPTTVSRTIAGKRALGFAVSGYEIQGQGLQFQHMLCLENMTATICFTVAGPKVSQTRQLAELDRLTASLRLVKPSGGNIKALIGTYCYAGEQDDLDSRLTFDGRGRAKEFRKTVMFLPDGDVIGDETDGPWNGRYAVDGNRVRVQMPGVVHSCDVGSRKDGTIITLRCGGYSYNRDGCF